MIVPSSIRTFERFFGSARIVSMLDRRLDAGDDVRPGDDVEVLVEDDAQAVERHRAVGVRALGELDGALHRQPFVGAADRLLQARQYDERLEPVDRQRHNPAMLLLSGAVLLHGQPTVEI
jgi:hypothetical protein